MAHQTTSPRSHETLQFDVLREIVRGIVTTHANEIDCHSCFKDLDRLAELQLTGKSPTKAMRLVQDHLDRCRDCREEFEALFNTLRATA